MFLKLVFSTYYYKKWVNITNMNINFARCFPLFRERLMRLLDKHITSLGRRLLTSVPLWGADVVMWVKLLPGTVPATAPASPRPSLPLSRGPKPAGLLRGYTEALLSSTSAPCPSFPVPCWLRKGLTPNPLGWLVKGVDSFSVSWSPWSLHALGLCSWARLENNLALHCWICVSMISRCPHHLNSSTWAGLLVHTNCPRALPRWLNFPPCSKLASPTLVQPEALVGGARWSSLTLDSDTPGIIC